MDYTVWISKMPLWAIFGLTVAICMAAVEAGAALASVALRRKKEKEPEGPLGSLVSALLGLLAFIMAFTFGIAASRFDTRKQLVLEEANAIGTTYLRASLLPEKPGREVRKLLREYARIRSTVELKNVAEVLRQSEEIGDQLWSQTQSLVAEDMDAEIRALFIESVNELLDLHTSRVTTGMQYHIPATVWLVVYLLAGASMLALGYQVGMSGVRRIYGTTVVAASFSLVILMIADLDRPGEGLLRVSQQPIADTHRHMLLDSD
jgi:hypothetical protein